MKSNPTHAPVVRCMFATLLALAAVQSSAQTAPASRPPDPSAESQSQPHLLDAITVTGSHIRRIDEERVLPVTTYDIEDLDLRAAATPVELFEYLPQAGEMPISEEGTLGASARGDVASISVRSLGSASTLTLVNGRRMPPHPISQAESGVPSLAVNINSLPAAAINRIEILRDGASAIYGADAAAGVVNALLDGDTTGTRLTLRGSITQHGGAGERRATVAHGRVLHNGRTKVRLSFDYFHRDILMSRDRPYARDSDMRRLAPPPWDGVPIETPAGTLRDNDYDNRSSTSVFGHFIRGTFQTVAGETQFIGSRPEGNRGIATTSGTNLLTTAANTAAVPGQWFFVPLPDGSVGTRQTTPSRNVEGVEREYYYNLNQNRHMLPRTDRYNLVTAFDHRLANGITLFGDVMYYHAESLLFRDPAGADATDDPNIFVPATNYWNPFGTRFYHPTGAPNPDGTPRIQGAPADVLIAGGTGVRLREWRAKEVDVESRAGRAVLGARGPLFTEWEWESAGLHGWARTADREAWNIRESRMREALARTDQTGLNVFGFNFQNVGGQVRVGEPYRNPDSVINPLYDDFVRIGRTSISSWDVKANGPVIGRWGRTVRAAAGLEARYETYKDWRPPYHGLNPAGSSATNPHLRENDNDFIGLSPNLNLSSDRHVLAGFVELLVPVFTRQQDIPGFRSLEFTAAGRYEKFSDFGDTAKPKYGMSWRPNAWVMVRASYNESFRAPNLVQTNTSPLQRSVSSVSDPYRFEVTGNIFDGSRSRTVFRMGNETLNPEEAENVTTGLVVEVPRLKGLTVSVDYWRIHQTNVIANVSASGQLRIDRDLLDAATQAQIAAGRPISQVVVQEASTYLGNSKVRRAPVTPADMTVFASYNAGVPPAQQRAPVGQVLSVVDDYLNLAARKLEGVDVAVQYRLPRNRLGTFTLRAEGAWLARFQEQLDTDSIVQDNLNENGITKWKANGSLLWRRGDWSAGWFTSFNKGTVDTSAALGAAGTDPVLIGAVLQALGHPKYLRPFSDAAGAIRPGYRVGDWINHNAYVNYRFPRRSHEWLREVNVRLGLNNVFDRDPPLADESRGYRTGGANPRGRQYSLQLSKSL
jgi:iron complex outermembrane recepter protein